MKKIILFCFMTISITTLLGQRFSLNEMAKICKGDWDEFDTYATAKGFNYNKSKSDEFSESKSYFLNHYNDNFYTRKHITKYYLKTTNSQMVSFQTTVNQDYLYYKNQLKLAGYKYNRTEKDESGGMSLYYLKGKTELALHSIKKNDSEGIEYMSYEISMTISSD